MDPLTALSYAALGAAAGLAIGCVGIGGVIIVPALIYVAGVSPQAAIAAALGAFVVSGVVGVYAYSRAGSIRWRDAAPTWIGAVPGALAATVLPLRSLIFWILGFTTIPSAPKLLSSWKIFVVATPLAFHTIQVSTVVAAHWMSPCPTAVPFGSAAQSLVPPRR